jgi:DegV family protein with EDD domain
MQQKRIEIITDSTCDIPQHLIDQYQLIVQPYILIWGDREYRDRVDISAEEYYRRMQVEKELPTTSLATVHDFTASYQCARERGADEIVILLVSGSLTGALRTAKMAANDFPIPVHVYDSRSVSMGLGWQVLSALRAREAGGDVTEILAAADSIRRRVHLYVYLETLYYAYRSGRIGNARRLMGAMLNVKPLVYVNHEEGLVEGGGMAISRKRGLELLYQKFFALLDTRKPMHVTVLQGNAQADAEVFMKRVENDYHPVELLTNFPCPILGLYTGPGAFAFCGYSEE